MWGKKDKHCDPEQSADRTLGSWWDHVIVDAESRPLSLERQLQEAMVAKDWPLVRELSDRLEQQTRPEAG